MTRHALQQHAPDGAIFAVSSFGPGVDGQPAAGELAPLGLEGPLGWVAEQLEARDRAADGMALGTGAPTDLPRLQRCVAAYERRYPALESVVRVPATARRLWDASDARRARASWLWPPRSWLAVLAGYDFWGFHRAAAFERDRRTRRPAVARRWSGLLANIPRCRRSGPPWRGRPAEEGRMDGQGGRRSGRHGHGTAGP